jgi:hypothetical protein
MPGIRSIYREHREYVLEMPAVIVHLLPVATPPQDPSCCRQAMQRRTTCERQWAQRVENGAGRVTG